MRLARVTFSRSSAFEGEVEQRILWAHLPWIKKNTQTNRRQRQVFTRFISSAYTWAPNRPKYLRSTPLWERLSHSHLYQHSWSSIYRENSRLTIQLCTVEYIHRHWGCRRVQSCKAYTSCVWMESDRSGWGSIREEKDQGTQILAKRYLGSQVEPHTAERWRSHCF